MRKITSLLVMLFSFVGIASAQVVESLDDLSNGKAYTLQCGRGYMIANSGHTAIAGSETLDESSTDYQFVIYKADDNYYLFSVGASSFVNSSATFVNTLAQPVVLTASTATQNTWVLSMNGNYMNMDNNRNILIDSWKILDTGNQYTITAVGDFDVRIIERVLYGPNLTPWLELAQMALDANEGYAGNDVLSAAITENSITDEDGKASLDTKIANIQAAIQAYNATAPVKLLTSLDGLPGVLGDGRYAWESGVLDFGTPVSLIRFIVNTTNTGGALNNHQYFSLGEMRLYSEDGTAVALTVDNLVTNAPESLEGPIANLVDNNVETFFHSQWSGNGPAEDHYVEIALPEPMQKIQLAFDSRNQSNVPSRVYLQGITSEPVIEAGVYRIVSGNRGFSTTKAISGAATINGGSAVSPGWEDMNANDPEQYWQLSGNAEEGYTIQNYDFGIKQYIVVGNGQGQRPTLGNEGTKFNLTYLGADQYNITAVGSEYPLHCANQADGFASSALTTWAGVANSASAWTLVKADELTTARLSMNTLINAVPVVSSVSDNAIGTNPGQVDTEMTIDELRTAATTRINARAAAVTAAAGTDYSAMQTAYNELKAANDVIPATNALPQAGKYYRLKGGYSGNYAIAGNTGTNVPMAAWSEDNAATSIWYMDTNKLLNYSNGYYIYNTHSTGAIGNANTWTFANSSVLGTLTLRSNATGIGTWMYDNASTLDRTTGYNSTRSNWLIEEVTTLPVNISAVGYATLYAPVALEVPAEVTAYTATFETDKVTLNEVGNVIPANTGVVLMGEEGTYDFNITTTDVTVDAGQLQGQPNTVNVAADEQAYVLANGDNSVGFYLLNDTDRTVKGSRAYYVETAAETGVGAFIFDQKTTAIDGATLNGEKTTAIYDLSGRRVVKPTKGLYIVNGKKVYVK